MWNLYFNVTKCKILHIGKNNQEIDCKMKVSEDNYDNITKCEEEKDLGVIFNKYLSFDVHIQNSINKANSMIGIIRRTFTFIDGEIFTNLYKSLVRPHLEYGNIVWFPQLKRQSVAIEKVQRRASKLIHALKDLDYKERLRQLKLPTLKYRRYRGDLNQVFKIINGTDDLKFEDFLTITALVGITKLDSTRNSEHKLYHVHFTKTKTRKFAFSNRKAPT